MPRSKDDSLSLSNIEATRNTADQVDWYTSHREFCETAEWSTYDKVANFPIFASRQKITRFLEAYEFYKLAMNTPGCFLECGVASGGFLMALAHFCSIFEGYHYTRRVIGFDTFEGFTEPSPQDLSSSAKHMKAGGLKFESYDILKSAIELFDGNRVVGHIPKVELVKGDISKTLPKFLEDNPSLIVGALHLDLDLYQPTKDTLTLLKDRLPKGAIIIFDEPNHKDYPGETIAISETLGLNNIRMQRLPMSPMAAYMIVE